MLREVDGLNTAETAECLGVSEDVVKTRLSRSRAALRHQLAERAGILAPETFRFLQPRCDRVVALFSPADQLSPSPIPPLTRPVPAGYSEHVSIPGSPYL